MVDLDEKEKCIICQRHIFNYPSNWDPVCFDCWRGYIKERKY